MRTATRKPRLLVVGGKPFNIPSALLRHFEIAKHIEQDKLRFSVCAVDYIMVITNWVDHKAVNTVRQSLPGVPVVWVRKGWNSMAAEFVRRGILTEQDIR